MDEPAVEAAGIAPLGSLMRDRPSAHIDDIERNIRSLQGLAIPVAFGSNSTPGYHDPLHIVEALVAGGLGLPDRDYYLSNEPRFAEAREKYRAHVATVLTLGGMSDAEVRASAPDIVSLEKRLAEASLDSATAADPAATDHMVTFAQLKSLAPHFDWEAYFDEAGLPKVRSTWRNLNSAAAGCGATGHTPCDLKVILSGNCWNRPHPRCRSDSHKSPSISKTNISARPSKARGERRVAWSRPTPCLATHLRSNT